MYVKARYFLFSALQSYFPKLNTSKKLLSSSICGPVIIGSELSFDNMTIFIDPTARISTKADIEDSVRGSCISIGANTVIDSFVKIKPAGGGGNLQIGRNTVINSGVVLYTGNGVIIGNSVAIAANCVFAPVNHEFSKRDVEIMSQGFSQSKGGIIVEDDVWIGSGCVLLDGAILRKGCVIGAMSLVRGEIPAYSINAGHPIRLIGWRE